MVTNIDEHVKQHILKQMKDFRSDLFKMANYKYETESIISNMYDKYRNPATA